MMTMNHFKYLFLILMMFLAGACETKLPELYVKARTAEELKVHAFERCGRHYEVLAYAEDTARIKCLKK